MVGVFDIDNKRRASPNGATDSSDQTTRKGRAALSSKRILMVSTSSSSDDQPSSLEESFAALFEESLKRDEVKEGDIVTHTIEASNNCDLLFFTDLCQVYKARTSDFDDAKDTYNVILRNG